MAGLSLRKARVIIRKTFEAGKEMELKPLSVIVLDDGGNVLAFEREDGASPGRFQIAHGKAYGAVMLGMAGKAQMARAEQQAYFMAAVNGVYGGQVVPVPGGVLVRGKRGDVIGAVGVTGDTSDNDAEAAVAGVTASEHEQFQLIQTIIGELKPYKDAKTISGWLTKIKKPGALLADDKNEEPVSEPE